VLRARDTVIGDTPARAATSRIFAPLPPIRRRGVLVSSFMPPFNTVCRRRHQSAAGGRMASGIHLRPRPILLALPWPRIRSVPRVAWLRAANREQGTMPVATTASDQTRGAEPLAYVVACQPLHERLRDAVIQLGGLSLMTMLRREGAFDRETPLRLVREALAGTGQALGGLPVPPSAAHHHHHMREACCAAGRAADLIADQRLGRDAETANRDLSRELRAATDHLRHASRALPGFEMVDLAQSCCAAHAAAPAAETTELRF